MITNERRAASKSPPTSRTRLRSETRVCLPHPVHPWAIALSQVANDLHHPQCVPKAYPEQMFRLVSAFQWQVCKTVG